MSENIDYTQWLPRGVSIVNERRAAKGDLDGKVENGRIISVQVIDQTIAGNLVRRGFIEPYQRDYALDLMELRNALYGALNTKTSLSLFVNGGDTRVSRGQAQRIYEMVTKEIKRNGEKIIIRACTVSYEQDAAAKMIEGITVYMNEFKSLAKAMDAAINELNKELA